MRVLHCIASFGGGGAERQLAYLAPEMLRRGADVHVAWRATGPHHEALAASGVRLHQLRARGSYNPLALLELAALVRRLRPDVVQTWLPQMDVLGAAAALAQGVPVALSQRNNGASERPTLRERLRLGLGLRAGAVVSNSEEGAAAWRRDAPGARVVVIPNCMPLDALDATEPEPDASLGVAPGAPVLLFAGRYIPGKNVATLLRAFDAVLQRRGDAVAQLHGEGPDAPRLRALVATLVTRDRVRLDGYTRALWPRMRRASVFASVSEAEGMPNAVAEAARLGCPLVLSDIPAHRALLDDDCAWFVDRDDPGAIARALDEALDDRAMASRRAAAARAHLERFSIGEVASRHLALYERLRGDARATAPRPAR